MNALCSHITEGPIPYEFVLVLDDHLGPTEALVRCSTCQQPLLIELLDWREDMRLFRTAAPDETATRLLLRDLERGSCDINRAGEEVRQFALASTRLPVLLMIDTGQRRLVRRIEVGERDSIPGSGWRELPCDGGWIEHFQAARL